MRDNHFCGPKQEICLDSPPGGRADLRTAAVRRHLLWGVNMKWEFFERKTGSTFLRMTVRPYNRIIVLFIANWILVAILSVSFFDALWGWTFSNFSLRMVGKLGLQYLGMVVLLCLGHWLTWLVRIRLTDFEKSFWDFLGDTHRTNVVLGISPNVFPIWLILLGDLGTLGIMMYVASPLEWFYLLFILVYVAMERIPVYTELLLEKSYHEQWKLRLMNLMARWTRCLFSFLAMVLVLAALNQAVLTTSRFDRVLHKDVRVNDLIKMGLSAESSRQGHLNLEKQNLELLRKSFSRLTSLANVGFLILLSFGLAMLVFPSIKLLADTPKEWNKALGAPDESPGSGIAYFPFLEKKNEKRTTGIFEAAVFSHYALASILNLGGIAVGIDGLGYALFNKALLFKGCEICFSWLFAIPTGVLGECGGRIFSMFWVFCLSFPLILFLFVLCDRIMGSIRRLLYRRKKPILESSLEDKFQVISEFMLRLCQNSGMIMPELVITKENYMQIYIKGGLIKKRAILFISLESLKRLEKQELMAVTAHELGHLKSNLRRIEWLRALSVISFFSNYYLTLLLDTRGYEREADGFSINVTGDGEALIDALIKTATFNTRKPPVGFPRMMMERLNDAGYHRLAGYLRSLAASMEFFFGGGLLGYSHPPLIQRVADIRGMVR